MATKKTAKKKKSTTSKNGQLTRSAGSRRAVPTKEIDFQKEFAKLEKITDAFEAGKYDVEAGLAKFEEGLQIAQALQEHLGGVENRIEEIKNQYHELASENQTD